MYLYQPVPHFQYTMAPHKDIDGLLLGVLPPSLQQRWRCDLVYLQDQQESSFSVI